MPASTCRVNRESSRARVGKQGGPEILRRVRECYDSQSHQPRGDGNVFNSSDFYTSAYLLALPGVELVGVEWLGRRARFLFEGAEGVDFDAAITALRDGSATVVAKEFIGAIQTLKGVLFNNHK